MCIRDRGDVVKHIGGLGISPFIMQSTESLVNITLNSGLQKYGGDLYVGTMSIMTSIMQLIVIPVSYTHLFRFLRSIWQKEKTTRIFFIIVEGIRSIPCISAE